MKLEQRFEMFDKIIEDLQSTSSRIEKEQIIKAIPAELKEDFQYILEILAGKHKLGYTYRMTRAELGADMYYEMTFKEYIQPLFEPMKSNNFTDLNTILAMNHCQYRQDLIASIVNRTLRLGIGPSQLPKDGLAPMLAKKFEDIKLKDDLYYITEKLDGNRCIARYADGKWNFTSRNGKPLKVNINMGDLPTDVVYDGELLSPRQTYDSQQMFDALSNGKQIPRYGGQFNSTSGLINSKLKDKQLVYNIFDVMIDGEIYCNRRSYLNTLQPHSDEVRILPVLTYTNCNHTNIVAAMLDEVTSAGAEGLILNRAGAVYQHKRTDDLIKVKNTYTIDMLVKDWEYGNGKYDGMVGALQCVAITEDGKHIEASIGTGLSDEQRMIWADDPSLIIGKIVEVSYFSMSQSSGTYGTKSYSLRFPRLKRVRYDKEVTSVD